jgi:glycosyltransferase involved in cell wall biosynthesis
MVAYMYPPKWYLGQRRGIKGHEDLIDAITVCLNNGVDLRSVFIGGAWNNARWYENRVRAYASPKWKDRIIFLGTRNDVMALYPDLDVAVHPSHSENVGGAGESLLMGVPTIATDVGGVPDVVKDGQTGWLVPPRRPRQLAEKIIGILNDLESAKASALRGRELAKRLFDVRITARQVRDIYQMVLRESR